MRTVRAATLGALLALGAGYVAASPEPPVPCVEGPPGRTPEVIVTVTAERDSESGLWRYRYAVENRTRSPVAVGAFTLLGIARICDLESPSEWWKFPEWRGTDGVHWRAQPSETTWTSPRAIPPGGRLTGFAFRSYAPPGRVAFVCEADLPPREYADEDAAEDAFHASGGYQGEFVYENATSGVVRGPVGRVLRPCPGEPERQRPEPGMSRPRGGFPGR